jgi:hypothetical protein
MVPVAAIASETRGVEAEHSTDLPGAQSRDQSVETWSVDSATRRSAEIVVDDLDVGEAASPRDIDKLILAPLALKVRLHLLRRRLADIDDRLTSQHGCRKECFMRGHRRPPPLRYRSPRAADAPVT